MKVSIENYIFVDTKKQAKIGRNDVKMAKISEFRMEIEKNAYLRRKFFV